MRSFDPEFDYDVKDLEELKVAPWMVEAIQLNPEYTGWGPGDDYMSGPEDSYAANKKFSTWEEFGPWELDELNELVNFYFELGREAKDCETCGASGVHPDALWVDKSWYKHSSPFTRPTHQERMIQAGMHERFGSRLPVELLGRGSFPSEEILRKYKPEFRAFCEEMASGDGFWSHKITQDEVDALAKDERLFNYKGTSKNPTAAEINEAYRHGMGHDSINQGVCVKARCERFGIPYLCPDCHGHGYIYTAEKGHLGLGLWFIHPRKGASRGVTVERIQESQFKDVLKYLKGAAENNAKRFSKVTKNIK